MAGGGFRGGLDHSGLRQDRISSGGTSDGGLNGGWVAIKPQAGSKGGKGGWLDV